ncbi:hypothetical protein B0H14DRAFT_2759580 [Mycena olivaceomarginata]|nr:hypothetical protein B0H14DRAFT_2759580 [Mycena olivaceomarginata]
MGGVPNCVGFAGFSMLIWDHVDTFATEVEYIWGGEKGPRESSRHSCVSNVLQRIGSGVSVSPCEFSPLSLHRTFIYVPPQNRYLTPLGFIVNLFAYLSPTWTFEARLIPSSDKGAMTVIGIHVVGLMMLIRIKALYSDKRYVPIGVGTLWLIMFSIQAWLLSKGQPVVHNPDSGVKACTMIFPPELSAIASSSAWLPLLYDSCVLILTLIKTVPATVKGRRVPNRNRRDGSNIMKRLFQDGLIYYSAIFAVNAVLTIMIISAPPGLKNITAQLELLYRFSFHFEPCTHSPS